MTRPSSSSPGDSAYTSAVSRSSVARSSGSPRSTISTRCLYQSAADRPTRLEVATSARPPTRSGWSMAARIAIVPPREKPATCALSASSWPIQWGPHAAVPARPPPAVSTSSALEEAVELVFVGIAHDERHRHLAELSIRPADHARVEHRRVHTEHRFHLVRIDVRAAPDDDVLHPADDVKES